MVKKTNNKKLKRRDDYYMEHYTPTYGKCSTPARPIVYVPEYIGKDEEGKARHEALYKRMQLECDAMYYDGLNIMIRNGDL